MQQNVAVLWVSYSDFRSVLVPKLDKLYSLELLNLSWTQITDLSPLIKLSSLNRVELVGYKFSEFTSEHVIKNAQALGELRAKRIEVRTQ